MAAQKHVMRWGNGRRRSLRRAVSGAHHDPGGRAPGRDRRGLSRPLDVELVSTTAFPVGTVAQVYGPAL